MKRYKTVVFVQSSECQAALHKCKALYRRLSDDGSVATQSLSIISHFFGNNGWILTSSMSSHSQFQLLILTVVALLPNLTT